MFFPLVRRMCVAALTVIAIPYAVAVVTNILCGWPLCARPYRRAFRPRKVFALNWALLFQLSKLQYVGLMIRWRRFYQNASRNRILKVSIKHLVMHVWFLLGDVISSHYNYTDLCPFHTVLRKSNFKV